MEMSFFFVGKEQVWFPDSIRFRQSQESNPTLHIIVNESIISPSFTECDLNRILHLDIVDSWNGTNKYIHPYNAWTIYEWKMFQKLCQNRSVNCFRFWAMNVCLLPASDPEMLSELPDGRIRLSYFSSPRMWSTILFSTCRKLALALKRNVWLIFVPLHGVLNEVTFFNLPGFMSASGQEDEWYSAK